MSHAASTAGAHKPHILPLKLYAGIWIALLVLTVTTVKVSYYDFGVLNLVVAMGIAALKGSLVVLFFMHLKYDEKFNAVLFVGALVFLSIFMVLTLADTMERGKVDPIEAGEITPVPARPGLEKMIEAEGGVPLPIGRGLADTVGTGAAGAAAAAPAAGGTDSTAAPAPSPGH
jgi:cytochrome c oxidase subunit 4